MMILNPLIEVSIELLPTLVLEEKALKQEPLTFYMMIDQDATRMLQ